MKFYDREQELETLNFHWGHKGAVVDVLIGRRRIGKTLLALEYAAQKKYLYFFVSRKESHALLEEWAEIMREKFPSVASFKNIDDFLRALFHLIGKEKYLVIFDEFQNFKYTAPSVFSDFQKHIDAALRETSAHILFLGSSTTLMEKIFKDKKEPLFNRATRIISLDGFTFPLIYTLLRDIGISKSISFCFDIYSLFGGVPYYYDILEKEKAKDDLFEIIMSHFLTKNSYFTEEGFFLLQSEFGRNYQRYFDILMYMSEGETKISSIAARVKEPVNKVAVYIHRLENYYNLIEKRVPILYAKKSDSRYYLKDVFLRFWFRYIYKRLTYIERGADQALSRFIMSDLSTYQGQIFEDLAINTFAKQGMWDKFGVNFTVWEHGRFWNGKSGIEIDVVAVDKEKRNILFVESKLNPKRITKELIVRLKEKGNHQLFDRFANKHFGVFTLTKATQSVINMCEQEKVRCMSFEDGLLP